MPNNMQILLEMWSLYKQSFVIYTQHYPFLILEKLVQIPFKQIPKDNMNPEAAQD